LAISDPRMGGVQEGRDRNSNLDCWLIQLAMAYVIKAAIGDIDAKTFDLPRQKTMYGGRRISVGDTVFVFASENEGGPGLIARGVVTAATAVPQKPGVERQTPCVNVSIERAARAKRRYGRAEIKPFKTWNDGQPATELNFKFYRQATNKIAAISDETAAFLERFFR
jgi:hypothetical protein